VSDSRRRIDRALEPDFVADLEVVDLPELRERRDTAEDVESMVSYYRRLIHGRMDLLDFELTRRNGEEQRTLLEALPEILARGMVLGTEPNLRYIEVMPPLPESTGRRLIDKIMDDGVLARLPDLTEEEIASALSDLKDFERQLSAQRKQLHIVIDRLQEEIVSRYRTEHGSPTPAG
jgi:RsiG-like